MYKYVAPVVMGTAVDQSMDWTRLGWLVGWHGTDECADRSAGPCIPQPIPQQDRLVNNVTPVLVDNILNPQGIWVPAKNINGLEKVPTLKKQLKDWSVPKEQAVPSRVSGRARAPPTFYQAGTNGK